MPPKKPTDPLPTPPSDEAPAHRLLLRESEREGYETGSQCVSWMFARNLDSDISNASLNHLPPPFPRLRTVGDAIGRLATGESGPLELKWDRFSFVIPLGLYESKLTKHNMIFVGRFTTPAVSEWWDNDGHNYCISFKRPPFSPSTASQNRSFTAPSSEAHSCHRQCFSRDRHSSLPQDLSSPPLWSANYHSKLTCRDAQFRTT